MATESLHVLYHIVNFIFWFFGIRFFRIYSIAQRSARGLEQCCGNHCCSSTDSIKPSLGYSYEPRHDKTNKVECAPSEDSDQPGHSPSLIRVFAVRMKKPWVLTYPLCTQRRLWSAQAHLSLRWAHMLFCWFCHGRLISCVISLLPKNPIYSESSYHHSAGIKCHNVTLKSLPVVHHSEENSVYFLVFRVQLAHSRLFWIYNTTVELKDLLWVVSSVVVAIAAHEDAQLYRVWYIHILCDCLASKWSLFQNLHFQKFHFYIICPFLL